MCFSIRAMLSNMTVTFTLPPCSAEKDCQWTHANEIGKLKKNQNKTNKLQSDYFLPMQLWAVTPSEVVLEVSSSCCGTHLADFRSRKASPSSHFRKWNLVPAKLTYDKLEQSFESNSVPCTLYGKQPQKSLLLQEANLPLLLQNNEQALKKWYQLEWLARL